MTTVAIVARMATTASTPIASWKRTDVRGNSRRSWIRASEVATYYMYGGCDRERDRYIIAYVTVHESSNGKSQRDARTDVFP